MSTDLAEIETHPIATRHESTELSVEVVLDRVEKITELMRRAMRPGIDYGVIPGTNSKPTLMKPGAEKLCVMFRLAPEYKTAKVFDNGHLTVESTCRICDMAGNFLGEASSMCSTRESKYAYRKAERLCPQCSKPAIIKGKKEYGGGWLCWPKKGGCNAKFADDDIAITAQEVGRIPNEDLADSYNTVLRIAEKRSLLAAVRLVTGSSALFDEPDVHHEEEGKEPEPEPAKEPPQENLWPWEHLPTVKEINAYLASPVWKAMNKTDKDTLWKQIQEYAKTAKWTLDRKSPNPFSAKEDQPMQADPTKTSTPTTTDSARSTASRNSSAGSGTQATSTDPELADKIAKCREWLNTGPSCSMINGYLMDVNDGPAEHRLPLVTLVSVWCQGQGFERDVEGRWRAKIGGNE